MSAVTAAVTRAPRTRVWLLPCLLAPPMLIAAELSGRRAVLVPPVVALAFMVWVLRRPEMLGSRWRVALLPTVCAAIGVAGTRAPGPRWLVTLGVLTVVVALLQLTRSRVAPAMAAAVLPVVFDVRGPEYVLAVLLLCAVVAATAPRLPPPAAGAERAPPVAWPWPRVAVFWTSAAGWIALSGGVLALPPIVVAPPLLVAALEFALLGGGPVVFGIRRCALLAVAALVGASCLRWVPVLWVAGTVAVVVVALLAAALDLPLGPALAISLVPFVARVQDPVLAAAGVGLGAAVLHLAAWGSLVGVPRAAAALRRGRARGLQERPA